MKKEELLHRFHMIKTDAYTLADVERRTLDDKDEQAIERIIRLIKKYG